MSAGALVLWSVLWSHRAEALASGVAGALVAAVWQGALLVGMVALAMRALPGLSAGLRGRLWLGVLLGLVVLPGAEMLLPAQATSAAVTGVRVAEGWSVALVAAWAVLVLARGLQLAASAVRLRRVARGAQRVEAPVAVRPLLSGVELCVSEEAGRPSVVGWSRPRILLPPTMWAAMTEAELRQVVLHEMEHLRRGDQWTNLLQKAALVAMPLSPAAMWVERRLCLERELACDDGVLRVGGGRKAYAACLARLAEHAITGSRVGREAVLALGAWGRQSELGLRVRRLLGGPERVVSAGRRRAAVAAVAGLVVLGGAGLTEAPRLVWFGPAQGEVVAEAHVPAAMPPVQAATPVDRPASTPTRSSVPGERGGMVLASAQMPRSEALRVANDGPGQLRTARVRRPARRAGERSGSLRLGLDVTPPVGRLQERRVSATLSQADRGGWVVLRSLGDDVDVRTVHATQVFAVAVGDEISPSYAAVPVADGWLVVQL